MNTQLLAVLDASDTVVTRFEYAGGRMPVAMVQGEEVYYLAYDQVGSLRAVYTAAGALVRTVEYDAWGNILSESPPATGHEGLKVPFGFAGGLHDRDTGLVLFGLRNYDPETGRWTSRDPIGLAGGDTDLYAYCGNDPVNAVDPTGLYVGIIQCGNNVVFFVPIRYEGPGATPNVTEAMNQQIEATWTGTFGPYNVHTHVVAATDNMINNGRANIVEVFTSPRISTATASATSLGHGKWDTDDINSLTAAHEVGHFMGLHDAYEDNRPTGGTTRPKTGWEGSIMAQVGPNAAVDERLINEILKYKIRKVAEKKRVEMSPKVCM